MHKAILQLLGLALLGLSLAAAGCGSDPFSLGGISAGGQNDDDKRKRGEATADSSPPPGAPGYVPEPTAEPCANDQVAMAGTRYDQTAAAVSCSSKSPLSEPACLQSLSFSSPTEVTAEISRSQTLKPQLFRYESCGNLIVIRSDLDALALRLSADGRELSVIAGDVRFAIAP